nr:MAG TPA: hypothetical protein [Caudoviricetes sp.]
MFQVFVTPTSLLSEVKQTAHTYEWFTSFYLTVPLVDCS